MVRKEYTPVVRLLVSQNMSGKEIIAKLGLPDDRFSRQYISDVKRNRIKSKVKSSTTIPRAEMPTGVGPQANGGG